MENNPSNNNGQDVDRADFRFIAKAVTPHSKVLDLGCGDGSLFKYLKQTRQIHGYGVEIDSSRMLVYSTQFSSSVITSNGLMLLCAIASAFVGTYAGNKLLKKVTVRMIQWGVGGMLILIALAIGAGVI